MSALFVKLTAWEPEEFVWINLALIEAIVPSRHYPGKTALFPANASEDSRGIIVNETPEEIAQLATHSKAAMTGFYA